MMLRIKNWISGLMVCMCLSAVAVGADENDPVAIADSYMEVYRQLDLAKMEPFYTEDAVFTDPTSLIYGDQYSFFDIRGRDQIIKRLSAFLEQVGGGVLTYDITAKYESAGYVVYQGLLSAKWANSEKVAPPAPITTIIHVRDGKVAEHRDYFDYRAAM